MNRGFAELISARGFSLFVPIFQRLVRNIVYAPRPQANQIALYKSTDIPPDPQVLSA